MATPRPTEHAELVPQPEDDGLFGPGSVTWEHPSLATSIAAASAVMIQMLHPRVVRVIDQSSSVFKNPELRARLTADFGATVIYGDTGQAEAAGATLRALHGRMTAIDPETGEKYDANQPDLLLWVHNALVWANLQAYERYGPQLTPDEQERYLREWDQMARVCGVDMTRVAPSVAALDAYMQDMLKVEAYTLESRRIRDLVVPQGLPKTLEAIPAWILAWAAVDLMSPEQQELYGFRINRLGRWTIRALTRLLVRLSASQFTPGMAPKVREYVMLHAFGQKTRAARKTAPVLPADGGTTQAAN